MEWLISRTEGTPSFHVAWRHWQASSFVLAHMHAALHARRPRWTGAPWSLSDHCSRPYPPLSVPLRISTKSWTGAKFPPKWKLCKLLQATNHILVPKTDSKWKIVNLAKQLELQISNWGNSNFWIGADQNFQNYFWFSITTWKIPNMKVVQLFEPYNFHVGHFSRFQIDLELEIQIGKGDTS